jgi:flagella basal body P-ring formation protein FlgA
MKIKWFDIAHHRLAGLAVALLLMQAQLCWSSTGNDSTDSASQARLTIHLPNEAAVESESLTLGQVAVVTGQEPLAAKAREVMLGRISLPGQKITIDRSLILSRLACSGMPSCDPVLSGADKVTVSRMVKVIKGGNFIESASSFLADNVRERSIARWEPLRLPAELVLSNQAQSIELLPRLVSRGVNGQATTEVSVVADGEVIGTRQVVFRPKYNIRRVVTLTDMAAGATITPENTRIEKVVSDEQEPADWAAPYGLVAVRNLAAGTVIGSGMAKVSQPPVVIERNQTVVIRIERPGLVVTAMGKAIQQGKLGECIKVRNVDSQRVILAKVNEDGTVEPVF